MSAYRRVAVDDRRGAQSSDDDESTNSHAGAGARRTRAERATDKLHALAWILAAYLSECPILDYFLAHCSNSISFTDTHDRNDSASSATHFFTTLWSDERIIRPLFNTAMSMFALNTLLLLYLTVYLPWRYPVDDTFTTPANTPKFWNAYCPRVIPTMTALGVMGSLLLVRACFPVWSFLTPLILGVIALGFFFSLHFVPSC